MGNIATYETSGEKITNTYDAQGQLLKAVGDETYTYTYDAAGNLLTANGHTYTYGNTNWRDLLTAFDGESITYDAIGNPTSYYNGTRWTFGWSNGRQLTSASNGTSSITYTYTADGMRTSKVVDGVAYNYYYASGKLIRDVRDGISVDYFYDEAGRPYAFEYGGYYYYYITNLQGDVIAIMDAWGAEQGSYEYDPYGNIVSCTGWAATFNPLRYRGYYYDTETGLYYLQSRYYDPSLGRFLNADAYASTGQGLLGNNMFAYCLNNPVNYSDSCGHMPHPADDPFGELGRLIGKWINELLNTDEDETDKNGNPTLNARIKKTGNAIFQHIEFSAGVGQGLYAEGEILDIGASIGMYGNYGTTNYNDGEWYTGQELYTGLSVEPLPLLELGFGNYMFLQKREVMQTNDWMWYNDTIESITIFSAAGYLIGGGSIYIGFDVISFFKDRDDIWFGG